MKAQNWTPEMRRKHSLRMLAWWTEKRAPRRMVHSVPARERARMEVDVLRDALADAAEILDTATLRTSTKIGNAARARGWLERWAHLLS